MPVPRLPPGLSARPGAGLGSGRPLRPPGKVQGAAVDQLLPFAPRPTMAGGRCGPLLAAILAAWVAVAAATEEKEAGPEHAALSAEQSMVLPMTASNWTLVMEGEWMLKL